MAMLLRSLSVVVLGVSSHAAATSSRSGASPLQKVIQMLQDMAAKGKTEKHEEEVAFAKFTTWCQNTLSETAKRIEEASAQIDQLDAAASKAGADAEELADDIKDLEAAIAANSVELQEATTMREKEHADYSATQKDLSESVDAIERAVAALKSRAADVPQAVASVAGAPHIPAEAKAAISSFMELAQEGSNAGAPEANAYEFQSGSVVSMLEKLRLKFQDQRTVLEKEEANRKQTYEVLKQKLADILTEDKRTVTEKTARKAKRLDDMAIANEEKTTTEALKAEDEKKLADTRTECHAKSVEFEKAQVVRSEEVKVIQQAVEILSSDEVTGTADKHLPALVQVRHRKRRALVQLRGGSSSESPEDSMLRESIVDVLRRNAQENGSRYLTLMATHAQTDPFGKVKKMIKDMIVRLMEEANAETDRKGYCDAELSANEQTRTNKQAEVEELSATVEKAESEIARLAEELAELSNSVSELTRQQAEATVLRKDESARNTKTIEEARTAQVAVERAMKVLKDFYGSVQGGSALLQSDSQDALGQEMSQASNEPYTGMQSESGGVIVFLEVVLSDFARLETQTTSDEDTAASEYKKFMDESTQNIAVTETAIRHQTETREQFVTQEANAKQDLQLTQKELESALAYYEKLKPQCVDAGLSYDERVRMREEEIRSLKEALQMLDQQDLA